MIGARSSPVHPKPFIKVLPPYFTVPQWVVTKGNKRNIFAAVLGHEINQGAFVALRRRAPGSHLLADASRRVREGNCVSTRAASDARVDRSVRAS